MDPISGLNSSEGASPEADCGQGVGATKYILRVSLGIYAADIVERDSGTKVAELVDAVAADLFVPVSVLAPQFQTFDSGR